VYSIIKERGKAETTGTSMQALKACDWSSTSPVPTIQNWLKWCLEKVRVVLIDDCFNEYYGKVRADLQINFFSPGEKVETS
jgi:hypothetical protein